MLPVIISIIGLLCGFGALMITENNWEKHLADNTLWLGHTTIILGLIGIFWNGFNLLKALVLL